MTDAEYINPTDIDATDIDATDIDREADLGPDERGTETPAEDAAEQNIPADPGRESPPVCRGMEVGEWDAVEQSRVVDMEDDYR